MTQTCPSYAACDEERTTSEKTITTLFTDFYKPNRSDIGDRIFARLSIWKAGNMRLNYAWVGRFYIKFLHKVDTESSDMARGNCYSFPRLILGTFSFISRKEPVRERYDQSPSSAQLSQCSGPLDPRLIASDRSISICSASLLLDTLSLVGTSGLPVQTGR